MNLEGSGQKINSRTVETIRIITDRQGVIMNLIGMQMFAIKLNSHHYEKIMDYYRSVFNSTT